MSSHPAPVDSVACAPAGRARAGLRCRVPCPCGCVARAWRTGLTAALVAQAVLASARPALAQAEIELLNATLTPKDYPQVGTSTTVVGCLAANPTCSTRMTDADFTEAGTTYLIRTLSRNYHATRPPATNQLLNISFETALSTRLESMTLHVDNVPFVFADAGAKSATGRRGNL